MHNEIGNIHRNIMGTVSFDGKFEGMRKPQDFIVYPMKDSAGSAQIQSDTRIGTIDLETGAVLLTDAFKSGAYFAHMVFAKSRGKLAHEQLFMLKAEIMGSASGKAGTSGIVFVDNSAALEVFGVAK